MARIIYSAIVSEIRGSIAGTTFQRNAFGNSVRNKPIPNRIQSTDQLSIRRMVSYISQQWFLIGAAKRSAWSAWALAHPVFSKHNPTAVLSGYQYFLKYNMILYTGHGSFLDEPIAGSLSTSPSNPTLQTDGIDLFFAQGAITSDYNISLNVFISPTIRETISFRRSATRFMVSVPNDLGTHGIGAQFKAKFGYLPGINDNVMVALDSYGLSSPYLWATEQFLIKVTSI